MGLLDSLSEAVGLKDTLGQLEAGLFPSILGEVLGNGGQGGLSTIVSKLEETGLGEQVKSWLGSGQNLPVSGDQLKQALGNDQIEKLAARFGIPVDTVLASLAEKVPDLVDAASPHGSLPPSA